MKRHFNVQIFHPLYNSKLIDKMKDSLSPFKFGWKWLTFNTPLNYFILVINWTNGIIIWQQKPSMQPATQRKLNPLLVSDQARPSPRKSILGRRHGDSDTRPRCDDSGDPVITPISSQSTSAQWRARWFSRRNSEMSGHNLAEWGETSEVDFPIKDWHLNNLIELELAWRWATWVWARCTSWVWWPWLTSWESSLTSSSTQPARPRWETYLIWGDILYYPHNTRLGRSDTGTSPASPMTRWRRVWTALTSRRRRRVETRRGASGITAAWG